MKETMAQIGAAAPRWVLASFLVASGSLNCFLGACTVALVIDRIKLIERDRRDEILDKYAELSERTARAETQIRLHSDLFKDLSTMQADIRDMNNRLRRKGI